MASIAAPAQPAAGRISGPFRAGRDAGSWARAWAALLLTWAVLSVAGHTLLGPTDPKLAKDLAALPATLTALVAVAGVWRPRRWLGVALAVPAALAYAGAYFYEARAAAELTGDPLAVRPLVISGVLALVGLLVTGLLAEALALQLHVEERRQRQDAQLIEELTPTTGSGAFKREHLARHLDDEIVRARRYRHPVSLSLVGIMAPEGEPDAPEVAAHLVQELARAALGLARGTDRIGYFDNHTLAVILPHTEMEGATKFLGKLRTQVMAATQREICAGVAEFPDDASNAAELREETLQALEFARASRLTVVSRVLLAENEAAQASLAAPQ